MTTVIKGDSNINLDFSTGGRITGDFSNATVANRVMFQTSTANTGTFVSAIANGTVTDNTGSGFVAWSNSDPTASQAVSLFSFKNLEARLTSGSNTGTYAPLTFYTGGSERMRVDTSGNVGIGTSSPNKSSSSTALTVNTGTAANYSAVEWSSGNTLNYHINANDSAIYHVAAGTRPWIVYTNGSERMRIDSSGNVGIGTSSPATKLSVVSATNSGISVNDGTVNTIIYNSTGGVPSFGTTTNHPIDFYTNNTARASITADARLLVGTTTGIANGTFCVKSNYAGAEACSFQGGSNGYIVTFHNTSGTLIGSITGSTGSTTAYNTSSDYRLKENIAPMTGALATVAQLKPCTYTWKVDGVAGQGFIAHELQEVVPDCVSGEKDAVNEDGSIKPQGIDTSFLVATLTAALQEAHGLIKDQATAITALTARVEALEGTQP